MTAAHNNTPRPSIEEIFAEKPDINIIRQLQLHYPELKINQNAFDAKALKNDDRNLRKALTEAAKYGSYAVTKYLMLHYTFSEKSIQDALAIFSLVAHPKNAPLLEKLFFLLLSKTTIANYDRRNNEAGGLLSMLIGLLHTNKWKPDISQSIYHIIQTLLEQKKEDILLTLNKCSGPLRHTPLASAISVRHKPLCKLLCEYKADLTVTFRNNNSNNAEIHTAISYPLALTPCDKTKDIFKTLINLAINQKKSDAQFDLKKAMGPVVLSLLAPKDESNLELALKNGANVNALSPHHENALFWMANHSDLYDKKEENLQRILNILFTAGIHHEYGQPGGSHYSALDHAKAVKNPYLTQSSVTLFASTLTRAIANIHRQNQKKETLAAELKNHFPKDLIEIVKGYSADYFEDIEPHADTQLRQ